MTPHQLINAVCVRLDADEFEARQVASLERALAGWRERRDPGWLDRVRGHLADDTERRPDDADA